MNLSELIALKDDLRNLTAEIGSYQLANLGRDDLVSSSKSSSVDLVTEVDQESERRIIRFIKERYPDHAILAEESGSHESDSEYTWIIDPVDGTTNYAHGYPMFCIAIGLQHKEENILGTIHLPFFQEFYWAIKGEGAYCNEKRIHVSRRDTLKSSILVTGFPYNKAETEHNNLKYFNHLMPKLAGIRRSGSACFDLVHVACGRLEGYFEMYLNQWDYEPGKLIVEEAGGKCSIKPLRGRFSTVATNGLIHELLRTELHLISKEDYA